MAKIVEYREIPLDDLVIGKGQVRTQDPGKEIDSLARSIEAQGLLQPIVVCEARQSGKWEILVGQRRFLAHKILGKERIPVAVLDQRVEEGEAKAISITENLIRRKLAGKDLIDGVTYLYNIYGTARAVADTTGLPYQAVLEYVKYPRLLPQLKKMVDEGTDVNVALKAQDAATQDGEEPNLELAIKLVQEMPEMTDVLRRKVAQECKRNPDRPLEEIIETAKEARVMQIVVSVTQDAHDAIRKFARKEGTTQDGAAATLIEEALISRGLLEE